MLFKLHGPLGLGVRFPAFTLASTGKATSTMVTTKKAIDTYDDAMRKEPLRKGSQIPTQYQAVYSVLLCE